MNGRTIPHHQQLAIHTTPNMPQKGDRRFTIQRLQPNHGEQRARRRDATHDRQMIARVLHLQHRCATCRRIGSRHKWQQVVAGFIDENQFALLQSRSFFTSGHTSLRQAPMAVSSRWLARTTGFCGVQPICLSKRETCVRSYVTPNSCSITQPTRRHVHSSPLNPYASAPCDSKSGNSHRSCLLSRRGAPERGCAAKAVCPASRASFSHWLTAPLVTPSAAAMSHCFQPCSYNATARYRRASCHCVHVAVAIGEKFSYLCNSQYQASLDQGIYAQARPDHDRRLRGNTPAGRAARRHALASAAPMDAHTPPVPACPC